MQRDFTMEWFSFIEVPKITAKNAFALHDLKFHIESLIPVSAGAAFRAGRQLQLSHWKCVQYGFGMLPALLKIKKRNGLQSDITVIGDCEGDTVKIVQYQIIIPFLDSPAFCFNILSAIFLQQ